MLPAQQQKFVVRKLSSNFREATELTTAPVPKLKPGQVLVRVVYVGINASDINFTAGKYLPGVKPPFDAGMEGLGIVVAVSEQVKFKIGTPVTFTGFGAFAEFVAVSAKAVIPVPSCDPGILSLLVSGLTASIALEQVGQLKQGQTVLVTAAAGGTGVYAVQLAKLAGCHVIGTCSSSAKVDVLKSLGCDRVVNYKTESLAKVLKSEYPKGVDVVYESVGGDMFDICVRNLAVRGRLIVIGWISGYQDQSAWGGSTSSPPSSDSSSSAESKTSRAPLPVRLLANSSSVCGFFLSNYPEQNKPHMQRLINLVQQGKLKTVLDPTPFRGLNQIPQAIDHMYAGKNSGKVVVQISDAPSGIMPRSQL